MKKYLYLALVVCSFHLSYADDSFVGDISNSMVNDSFSGQDLQKQTDGTFAGDDAINAQNSYFAGDSYQQQVGNSTVAPFAGDRSFTGDDYGK